MISVKVEQASGEMRPLELGKLVDSPSTYELFVRSKLALKENAVGLAPGAANDKLFPFQQEIVAWALDLGKAAVFAGCGLGKTAMQLQWARRVSEETKRPVLILAPLAVSAQTVREGKKFGIDVAYAKEHGEIRGAITITNYERLALFDAPSFAGIVLDESGIIKNYSGKVKQQIFRSFAATPYKLACTATPAPNDHLELGQHAEFLDVLSSHEMIARWFINDTSTMGSYRLKGHAIEAFWDWVASWARCFGAPSDIGHSDQGYVLPALNIQQHVIGVDVIEDRGDQLFRIPEMSATSIHAEKRRTAPARAAKVAELAAGSSDPWLIWCDTNYEEGELASRLPAATVLNGADSAERKEETLMRFVDGRDATLITKSKIAGFGMNFQHCAHMAFVGATFSYEQFYQSVRRCWRFGQKRPVEAHVVLAATERAIWDVLMRKKDDHEGMQREMFAAMRRACRKDGRAHGYYATGHFAIPNWIKERP